MNSAAVIGRQLRQQTATTGRTSGPLVPPGHKARPRTPSQALFSPYSPIPGSGGGSGIGGGGFGGGGSSLQLPYANPYSYSLSNQQAKEKQKSKEDEPKLRCTWHCFCVALKALSGGIILLVAGTIMSAIGFMAEANHNSTIILANETRVEQPLPSVFRNLTLLGPVIMGLGGIVVVAALVLTFEVRDTLGVKVAPIKGETDKDIHKEITAISGTASNRLRDEQKTSITISKPDDDKKRNKSTLTYAVMSDLSGINYERCLNQIKDVDETGFNSPPTARRQSILKTTASDCVTPVVAAAAAVATTSTTENEVSRMRDTSTCMLSRFVDNNHQSQQVTRNLNGYMATDIEHMYLTMPSSPQETPLSDCDGCSIRERNCRHYDSTAQSISSLYGIGGAVITGIDKEINESLMRLKPNTIRLIERQLARQQLLLQAQQAQLRHLLEQQMTDKRHCNNNNYNYNTTTSSTSSSNRQPKVFASMESDGLSSSSEEYDCHFQCNMKHCQCKQLFCDNNNDNNDSIGDNVDDVNTVLNATTCTTLHDDEMLSLADDSMCTPLIVNDQLNCNEMRYDVNSSNNNNNNSVERSCSSAASVDSVTESTIDDQCSEATLINNDKRFPLLRQGALGNGSLPKNRT